MPLIREGQRLSSIRPRARLTMTQSVFITTERPTGSSKPRHRVSTVQLPYKLLIVSRIWQGGWDYKTRHAHCTPQICAFNVFKFCCIGRATYQKDDAPSLGLTGGPYLLPGTRYTSRTATRRLSPDRCRRLVTGRGLAVWDSCAHWTWALGRIVMD